MPFDASPPETKPATPVLDPVIKRRWVDALRSGEFRQIAEKLTDHGNGRCVMGVYNEIIGGTTESRDLDVRRRFMARAFQLSIRNDTGESFASLANWIEVNL